MNDQLSLMEQLEAKSVALELVALALLRDKRGDAAFWSGLDKLVQIVLNLDGMMDVDVQARSDAVQEYLDSWRHIAGDDPNQPTTSQSGTWTPPPE